MKLKKSKIKSLKFKNIRDVVREEIQKSLAKEKQIMNSESIREQQKYFKTAKQKLMLDLVNPTINTAFKQTFARGIASQIVKSLIGKL